MKNENAIVEKAKSGDFDAIKNLIGIYESWIFNLALRMTGNAQDAEDATQEILMKMLTKLSTFENKSEFKTWLFRIAKNHILNMKRSQRELYFLSFEKHKDFIQNTDLINQNYQNNNDPEEEIVVNSIKNECLIGMLLCLDREQRFILILAFIFGVSIKTGSEIMEISKDSFKQRLHRARMQLKNYMNDNCSLIDRKNTCSCARKSKKAIESGFIDPDTSLFNKIHVAKIKEFVRQRAYILETRSIKKIHELFLQSPFIESREVLLKIDRLQDQ